MVNTSDVNEDLAFPADEEQQLSSGNGSDSSADDSDITGAEHGNAGSDRKVVLAKNETRAVFRLKLAVFSVLILAAVGVAVLIYHYTAGSQESQFEQQFANNANKLLGAAGSSLDRTLEVLDSFAVTLVSSARAANESWPFVALPNFALQVAKLLPLSDALFISVNPLVTPKKRKAWEAYSIQNDNWVNESMPIQAGWDGYYFPVPKYDLAAPTAIIHGDSNDIPYNVTRNMLPTWQNFPLDTKSYPYNWDWLSTSNPDAGLLCLNKQRAVVSAAYMIPNPNDPAAQEETKAWGEFYVQFISPSEEPIEPISDIFYPIIDVLDRVTVAGANDGDSADNKVVGALSVSIYWRAIFRDILPPGANGTILVVQNPCNEPFTYEINGPTLKYLGVGDKHDMKYDNLAVHSKLIDLHNFSIRHSVYSGAPLDKDFCPFTLHVYPSNEMQSEYTNNSPMILAIIAVSIFAFTSLVFCFYDFSVERRQKLVLNTAVRSTAIVSSLFPAAVQDRLYPEGHSPDTGKADNGKGRLRAFLNDGKLSTASIGPTSSPIAELYPDTTVLFADIAGFTAWSSERQPTQVFYLLETLYGAFDEIAKRRGVFKVETIGDCYVAVVGLPEPRSNHAVVMARFAKDIRDKMNELTIELEMTLGTGTTTLALRLGLNSGPTTAGVLRGEKARFQLFGDTVNTAARMESNGDRNRIQVSQSTADLVKIAGKDHWLTPREEKISCKGKGMMQTYWCEPKSGGSFSGFSSTEGSSEHEHNDSTDDVQGAELKLCINRNMKILDGLLKKVVVHRGAANSFQCSSEILSIGCTPRDEVEEIAFLPEIRPVSCDTAEDVELSLAAQLQQREFIVTLAKLYRFHPFHNFEHSSQVAMFTKKLLGSIVADENQTQETIPNGSLRVILSNPLTQFAIVFAVLIQNVDHPGVFNAQLVQEGDTVAIAYDGKSVAEQNSVDVAWSLLMEPTFDNLRACIYSDEMELRHFRQILVKGVIATDLLDNDLKANRDLRWEMSFGGKSESAMAQSNAEDLNRKATIIVELIVQTSDVFHMMQHFTVYKNWSLCHLAEMYNAYKMGRSTNDPTEYWYEAQLGFFDSNIIPLAKKLKECGVFGALSDELLNYADVNRREWETQGRAIIHDAKQGMIAQAEAANHAADEM